MYSCSKNDESRRIYRPFLLVTFNRFDVYETRDVYEAFSSHRTLFFFFFSNTRPIDNVHETFRAKVFLLPFIWIVIMKLFVSISTLRYSYSFVYSHRGWVIKRESRRRCFSRNEYTRYTRHTRVPFLRGN